MQQIATMYGALGFKVDVSGLKEFRSKLQEARRDVVVFSRSTSLLSKNTTALGRSLGRVNVQLSSKRANTNLEKTYGSLKLTVEKVDKAFKSIVNNEKYTTKSLGKINSSVIHGEQRWRAYADQVQRAKDLLRQANQQVTTLRANSGVNVSANRIANSGLSQRTGSNTNYNQSSGSSSGFFQPSQGFRNFATQFMPATVASAGAGAAGYALSQSITSGRQQMAMKQALMFATKDTKDFQESLQYVREEALRLGLSSAQLGKTFGTVAGASEKVLSREQLQKMFTGMNEYFTTVHAGDYEKGLMYTAIQQMFSIGKIQGQEIGQLVGTGLITRAQLNDAIMKAYNLKDTSKIEKMQIAGKLKPEDVIPLLFGNLSDRAKSSGAFDKAMMSSQVKQGQAKETVVQRNESFYENYLDPALSQAISLGMNLGKQLGDILVILKPMADSVKRLADNIQYLSTEFDKVAGEGSFLRVVLVGLILWFGRKLRLVKSVGKILKTSGSALGRFSRLGKVAMVVLRSIASPLNIVITLLWGLFEVGTALHKHMNGEFTWISVAIARFKTMSALFSLEITKMKLAWTMLRVFMSKNSPFNVFNLDRKKRQSDWLSESGKMLFEKVDYSKSGMNDTLGILQSTIFPMTEWKDGLARQQLQGDNKRFLEATFPIHLNGKYFGEQKQTIDLGTIPYRP